MPTIRQWIKLKKISPGFERPTPSLTSKVPAASPPPAGLEKTTCWERWRLAGLVEAAKSLDQLVPKDTSIRGGKHCFDGSALTKL